MRSLRLAAWLFVFVGLVSANALAQQTTGTIMGRVLDAQGAAIPGATVTATSPSTGFVRTVVSDSRRRVSPERAARRAVRHRGRAGRLRVGRSQGRLDQRRPDHHARLRVEGRERRRDDHRHGRSAPHRVERVVGGRRRGHRPHREPAAERPAVREPRGDDSRRGPRLPLGPDQEHAVLAADQRRQRPQRQLPDRRRRQQRRHRRRPAAEVPARGDPGVQLRHLALEGGERPQQRRRDEHRHQERHQRPARLRSSRCSATTR